MIRPIACTAFWLLLATSCPGNEVRLYLEPTAGEPDMHAAAIDYLERTVTRHGMAQDHPASPPPCEYAWRLTEKRRHWYTGGHQVGLCASFRSTGPVEIVLWSAPPIVDSARDSTALVFRLQRELTDSLTRFGKVTVTQIVPKPPNER